MEQSYAVGWGTLALSNTNIAQIKGHSGAVAFFGSLFLGPIVTLLLALRSDKPTTPPPGSPAV
jgi:hypothetical protein